MREEYLIIIVIFWFIAALQASNEGSIANTKMYRIEEVPKEEQHLSAEEMLVPVTHFYKEMHNAFGIPFFLKITNKETYASIRQRIKNRLNVPEKEWEKVSRNERRLRLAFVWLIRVLLIHSTSWSCLRAVV